MSRRKQAKPRSLKADYEVNESDNTTESLAPASKPNKQSVRVRIALPKNSELRNKDEAKIAIADSDGNCHVSSSTPEAATCDTNDSLESALGTERASSWRSETPDDVQTSPTPSSCATPSSTSDLAESDLTFTVGATKTTPYVCQFCDKAFPRLSFLKKHEQTHGDLLPFRCSYCSRLFKHKRSRDRHIKLHTGDKKYRCSQCEAAFSRSDHLKIHMKTHDNQKPFQCTTCNRGYNTAAALTSHMLNHKSKGKEELVQCRSPDVISCRLSRSSIPTSDLLLSHAISKQKSPQLETYQEMNGGAHGFLERSRSGPSVNHHQVGLESVPIPVNLTCMYCARDNFSTMDQLRQHVQLWHGTISSDAGGGSASIDAATASPGKPNRSLLFCSMCTMRFSTPSNLQAHQMVVHQMFDRNAEQQQGIHLTTELLPLICIECSLSFTNSSSFSEHIINVHGSVSSQSPVPLSQTKPTDLSKKRKKQKYTDQVSEMAAGPSGTTNFDSSSSAKRPKEDFPDPNQMPSTFICNQCNAAKPDFESFRQHLKTHLDGKSSSGVRSLIQAGELLAMLQQDGPALSCYCPQCGIAVDQSQFNSHYTSHFLSTLIEYGCQQCNKSFPKPDELQKHLLDMHALHMYRCTLCKDVFDSKVEIQVHFAVNHSNECTVYRCVACPNSNVTFNNLQDFDIHIQVYHNQFFQNNLQTVSCPNCPLTFLNAQDMHTHALTHRQCYQCFICPKRFSIEFLLDKHMQQCHSPIQGSGPVAETEANVFDQSCKPTSKSLIPSKSSPNIPFNKTSSSSSPPKQKQSNNNNVDMAKISDLITNNCDICNRNDFTNELELVNHRKLVHHMKVKVGPVSLHCAYCNENCKSRTELENHMKTHSQSNGGTTKHKCNICDELCPSAEILAQHKLTHCKVISGNACTQCKTVITSEEAFFNHVVQHSNSANLANPVSPTATSSTKSLPILLPTPCVICRQTLIAEIEVQYHAKFHLKLTSEFQCIICCKVFDKKHGILTTNGSLYGQTSAYTCKDCYVHYHSPGGKSMANGNTMLATDVKMENGETGPKKYTCIKCQETFESETAIQNHVALHAMAEGCSHECHLCRQVLATPLQLQVHLIEHTFAGCGSYTCYICSSVFTTAQGLQNHIMDHGLASRPYDCRHCNLKFFFRAELDNHAYVHIPELNFKEAQTMGGYGAAAGFHYVLKESSASADGLMTEKNGDLSKHSSPACICSNCKFTFSNASAYEKHLDRCCSSRNPTPSVADAVSTEEGVVSVKVEDAEEVDIKEENE